VKALLDRDPTLRFSISYTTRAPRNSEVDGRDYFFVSPDRFEEMVRENAFLEHARVFDNSYGTGRDHVAGLLAAGFSVVLEIDWQGARQVRKAFPSQSVFILPPSVAELERRLRGRKTDSEAVIERRLRDALADMTHWTEFDHVIVNDDFASALERLAAVINGTDGGATRTDLPAVRAVAEAIVAGKS
ncbi:MAG TPA: guanylate kinase, partial [Gammaproteobacteria bacterium]